MVLLIDLFIVVFFVFVDWLYLQILNKGSYYCCWVKTVLYWNNTPKDLSTKGYTIVIYFNDIASKRYKENLQKSGHFYKKSDPF